MSLNYKSVPFLEVKAEDGDGSEFSGYAAVFHNVDSYGDVILPGAFTKTIPDFLANGQICFNHGEVIGKPLEAKEDAKGLYIRGKISDTVKGRDCKTLLKDGVMRKMSIGYRTLASRPADADDVRSYWKGAGYTPTTEDEQNLGDNGRYLQFLHEVKLYEASPVGFPANTQADIVGVKRIKLGALSNLVERVKAGKMISKATHAYLKAVHDQMSPAVCSLKELLDAHDPDAIAGDDDEEDVTGSTSNGGDTDESSTAKPAKKPKSADQTPSTTARTLALAKARQELVLLSIDPAFNHTRASR